MKSFTLLVVCASVIVGSQANLIDDVSEIAKTTSWMVRGETVTKIMTTLGQLDGESKTVGDTPIKNCYKWHNNFWNQPSCDLCNSNYTLCCVAGQSYQYGVCECVISDIPHCKRLAINDNGQQTCEDCPREYPEKCPWNTPKSTRVCTCEALEPWE